MHLLLLAVKLKAPLFFSPFEGKKRLQSPEVGFALVPTLKNSCSFCFFEV